ncbi:Protein phosphatase 2C [Phytophthora palmivora]|uniref:Protein phosphatase 2C n=1 Tax=Phytophthora palmivora TaxID=4796 RepID=A0A2P4XTC4_9STRA|nr:Protein phosphatase 2C [Phytophthora palmivora]
MLLGRSPTGPRRSVIGSEEFTKSERSSFFGRQLARLLRRSSAVSVAVEQPSHALNSRGGAASTPSLHRAASLAAIGAVDPEIAFNSPQRFAVCTRNGARLGNEDRFRAIDNLDLYGRGLLEVAPASLPPFFTDLLQGRVLENFVVEGRAPALKIRNLLKHERSEDTQFYGVYDGHGGARASSLLALLFPVYILAAPEYCNDLAAACHSASMAINEEILKREKDGHCEGGATAVTLLIRDNKAVLSNTGDCRAIMVAKRDKVAQVTQLTTDHKASNDQEKQRIEEHGGMVLYVKGVARVNGRLAVARAFGDSELSQLVIADPEVTVHDLHREDEFIVMASDGLWDVLTNEQVASCIRNNPWLNVQEMANMLADRAVELGTMDNVTVVVVDVRGRVS